MKNKFLKRIGLILGVTLFVAAVSVNVITSKEGNLKNGYSSLFEVFNVAVASAESSTMSCNCSGGTGASSCSCESTLGPVQSSCSVSCNSGYYACCNNDIQCKCIKI